MSMLLYNYMTFILLLFFGSKLTSGRLTKAEIIEIFETLGENYIVQSKIKSADK